MEPSIQFVRRKDGIQIAYMTVGEGIPFVYPPPWISNAALAFEDPSTKPFWEKISQKARVVLYDRPGTGQSDRIEYDPTLELSLLDLETVVGHLGLSSMVLFGVSMGGPVAIAYTAMHPEKVSHLVLYGTFANGKDTAKDELKEALMALVKVQWGVASRTMSNMFIPGGTKEMTDSFTRYQRESATSEMAMRLMRLMYTLDVTDRLQEVSTPTLVLHREGDKMVRLAFARQLAAGIPNARLRVLKGDIHIPFLGDTETLIGEILSFIGADGKESMGKVAPDLGPSSSFGQTTILFSDIVSSTDLVTSLGDLGAREIFLQHDKLVRAGVKGHGGRELQHLGDGFMLSFGSATSAVLCAVEIQKEISRTMPKVQVRMGIHTGETILGEGNHPFGQAVVMASRLSSRAQGGQVLVSEVTKQLAAGSAARFVDKGRAKLKGFQERVKVYEVLWEEPGTE